MTSTTTTTSANGLVLQSTIDQLDQINAGDQQSQIDMIRGNLKTIYQKLITTDNDVLTKQSEVIDVLNREKSRLDLKKQSIDSAILSRERLIQMNDNYVKRNYQYIKICVAVMVILFTLLLLHVLDANIFIFVPVFSVVSILCIGYCIYTYRDLSRRSLSNYDEIELGKLQIDKKKEDVSSSASSSSSSTAAAAAPATTTDCSKEKCCGTGTLWDATSSLCLPKPATTTT